MSLVVRSILRSLRPGSSAVWNFRLFGWQAATVNLLKCVLALAFQSSERCAVRALAGGGPTLDRKLFAPCLGMLQQSTDKERYSEPSRQQPERNLRKLLPQW